NNQPMGFYSPQTLVADARRHGVVVRHADVNHSQRLATLEPTGDQAATVRLGLGEVRDVGTALADAIAERGPYASMEELVRRTGASQTALSSLATAGALDSLGVSRREALWNAGPASQATADRLEGLTAHTGT